jgi:alanine racemase
VSCQPNAWTELDCDILRRNLLEIKAAMGGTAEIIQVIKANAYGHGMAPVAATAVGCGVRWFLVSRLAEAVMLRGAQSGANILLLGAVRPSDLPDITRQRIIPVLFCEKQARELSAAASKEGGRLLCHVKIDTGMGRLGFPWEGAAERLDRLQSEGGLDIGGICMHFASADESGNGFVALQIERFHQVVEGCRARGMKPLFRHVANSAAYLAHPEVDFDGVRVGIASYGYGLQGKGARVQTRPCLQWKTRVLQVKQVPAGFPVSYNSTYVTPGPTWLATLDIGYSDGFPRLMSNRGYVLVGGCRVKVVGRVTMNFTVVDVGPQGGVNAGDEAVVIGTQGCESLGADELAGWCQTIPYEILTNIRSELIRS